MKKFIIAGTLLLALSATAQTNIYNTSSTLTSSRTLTLGSYYLHFKPTLGNGLFIKSDGNVGVGNTVPTEKLDVTGNIHANRGLFTSVFNSATTYSFSSNNQKFNESAVLMAGALLDVNTRARTFSFYDIPKTSSEEANVLFNINDRNDMARLRFWAFKGAQSHFMLYDKNQLINFQVSDDENGVVHLVMPKPASYVMIGTYTPYDSNDGFYHLSVGGKVRAHEVKVYTNWADYVFEDSYRLKPLEEVEQFINENGHLPNVPSAAVIEEKGLEVGNMMKIQQEKIEELTLYLIEQKKVNDQLKKDVEDLKAAVKALINKQ